MQIGVYGAGYLGTVVSACLADFGTPVSCCHPDSSQMVAMAQGSVPFHEKNLTEVIKRNVRSGRLAYSTDIESFARKAQVIFLAEDSPQHLTDLAIRIARAAPKPSILTIVTPVPVGTASAVEKRIAEAGLRATVVSQPMFFTPGCAIEDFNWPDRIILGTDSNDAVLALKQIFHSLVMRGVPVIVTNHETAELVRESATAFVATKISFINELASLCERVNADAVSLSLALGLDKKIAPRCLQPGAGMGGLFAESDMDSLADLAQRNGVSLKVLSAAREVNHGLADQVIEKISKCVQSVQNKDVGILGLAFKPNTNSVAGSSSVRLAKNLIAQGARVSLRSRRPAGRAPRTEWIRVLLRIALRSGRRGGCVSGRHRLAGIPRARFQPHQTNASPPPDRGYEKPARLRPPSRHGIRVRRRRPRLAVASFVSY